MSSSAGPPSPTPSTNLTYIFEYSRGLNGVDVPLDVLLTQIICATLGFVAVLVLCGRLSQRSIAHLRQLTSLCASQKQQHYWSIERSGFWPRLKKHLLYAPLGRKRHNREIQLSTATNMGTVPSRFHTTLIAIYFVSQVAYCCLLDYAVNQKAALIAEMRGRAGNLAVLNMVPLFLFAGRNNPLIVLLEVSFDTYNLFHRWLGRIIALESIVHVIAWFINASAEQNFMDSIERIRDTPFFTWGALGALAIFSLLCHSPSPIRHAFYETFLHLHQLFVFLAVLGIYWHLSLDSLRQLSWIRVIICGWSLERGLRLYRLFRLNVSPQKGMTKVLVQAMAGEACRVTFYLPHRVRINPGSHVYAYIPSVAWWMSHPFSVAWVEPEQCVTPSVNPGNRAKEKLARIQTSSYHEKGQQDYLDLETAYVSANQPTTVTLIMAARTGMTRQLYNKALQSPFHTLYTSGFIEGPYSSGPSSFGSYGTAILFSGGAGITHHLLHVRDLLLRSADGCVATQRIYLIWSVRSGECLSWIRQYMDQILALPNRRQTLVIKLFISKPKSSREIMTSPSETVQMFPGRCRPEVVLDEALPRRIGATVVSVCGPGAFADEVRAAARSKVGKGMAIDFVEEAFTW